MTTIYIVTLILISLTTLELVSTDHQPSPKQRYIWKIIWLVFSMTVFMLAASRIGGSDWENYETVFDLVATANSLPMAFIANGMLEPGYVALNYIISESGGTRRDLVILESGITAVGTYLVLTRIQGGSIIITWMVTLTFIGLMPVRQTMAISLIMIVFTATAKPSKVIATLVAPSIHISAIPLLLAKFFGEKKINIHTTIGLIILAGGAFFYMAPLLLEKIELYRDQTNELTNLSTGAVVAGKIITIAIITSLWYFASKRRQTVVCPKILDYKTLHLITIFSISLAIINPAFARLTSIFEIIYIWITAENIYHMTNKRERLTLYSVIAIIVILKTTKTLTQFSDVYNVCFLCAELL